jgi:glycolate oxidase iron-sulfur subunit
MKLALLPARLAKMLRLESVMPKFVRDSLALIPERLSATPLPEISLTTNGNPKGRVGFIRGCVMSVMFSDTNESSVQLLNNIGYEVVTPGNQGCCGALYAHSGKLESARECARINIAEFEKHDLDTIIINAAGCGSTLKEYGHLLKGDPEWYERAERFSESVKDISEFLITNLHSDNLSTLNFQPSTRRTTYHDACHLAHAQAITNQPRELVKMIAGENYVELPESDVCCGSAGSYNLTEPEMAERLQHRKVQNILSTEAEVVVTTNPGCILQIAAGLKKKHGKKIEVVHLADFLNFSSHTR